MLYNIMIHTTLLVYSEKRYLGSDWDLDGLLCAADSEHYSEHYFKVQNTDNGQKIYARGLAPEKGTADSGELYVSSNFIEAFKEFLSYMKTWVEDVRSVGSNKDKADTMKGHCDTVISKLTDTSLIASS